MSTRENQRAEIYALATAALERPGENPDVVLQAEALGGSLDDALSDDFIVTEWRASQQSCRTSK